MFEKLSRREVWRYLGYKGSEPDETVCRLVEETIEMVENAAVPRQVSRRVTCKIQPDNRLFLGSLEVTSQSLAKHLHDCSEVILFAATLGSGIDRLLQRYNRLQVSRAAILQAVSAAAVEEWCDQCQKQLEDGLEEGLYLRPRFSPGYGDLPLAFQRPLLESLEAGKRIGIELTDTLLMTPTKSVSAIIGITSDKKSCTVHHCAACAKTDCPFRKV